MNATVSSAVIAISNQDRSHRGRLIAGWVFAILLVVALAAYGYDYYTLSSAARPFSPKHAVLRPSGTIGLKLGFLGLGMFLAIFVYPLRKKWAWLGRQGSARHWLDFHVLLRSDIVSTREVVGQLLSCIGRAGCRLGIHDLTVGQQLE